MKYTLEDCRNIYKFFNRDFFIEELDSNLGRCTIFYDQETADKVFPGYDLEGVSGLSWRKDGKNYMYIDKFVLDSKKLMANTILHEMIHLYDQTFSTDNKRRYREGHGAEWTRIAKMANEIYGNSIGMITQYTDAKEVEKMDHYKMIHSTKSLAKAYIVVLRSRDLIPVKDLTPEQIEELKKTNIRGIFRIKPNVEQSSANRVKCYATFEQLMNDIELGVTEEEEALYGSLKPKLGSDSERIWINPKNG